jgi:hypothetical protein
MKGMNYKSSPRCEATDKGHRCRLRQDNHAIINGYNQHKWWGCGECYTESHTWLDMAYLTTDDYAERFSHVLSIMAEEQGFGKPEAWHEAVGWCIDLMRSVDIMEVR